MFFLFLSIWRLTVLINFHFNDIRISKWGWCKLHFWVNCQLKKIFWAGKEQGIYKMTKLDKQTQPQSAQSLSITAIWANTFPIHQNVTQTMTYIMHQNKNNQGWVSACWRREATVAVSYWQIILTPSQWWHHKACIIYQYHWPPLIIM